MWRIWNKIKLSPIPGVCLCMFADITTFETILNSKHFWSQAFESKDHVTCPLEEERGRCDLCSVISLVALAQVPGCIIHSFSPTTHTAFSSHPLWLSMLYPPSPTNAHTAPPPPVHATSSIPQLLTLYPPTYTLTHWLPTLPLPPSPLTPCPLPSPTAHIDSSISVPSLLMSVLQEDSHTSPKPPTPYFSVRSPASVRDNWEKRHVFMVYYVVLWLLYAYVVKLLNQAN